MRSTSGLLGLFPVLSKKNYIYKMYEDHFQFGIRYGIMIGNRPGTFILIILLLKDNNLFYCCIKRIEPVYVAAWFNVM